jgi:hypothetical protein
MRETVEHNGFWFDVETPADLQEWVAARHHDGRRYRFILGKDGQEWGDVQVGSIGRSTGRVKIPLVIYNRRSLGGPALMSAWVLRIETAKGRHVIWERKQ